ncbi:MAG: hypothetical protein WD155_08535, partial [Burkholderiales bacterium]
MRSGQRNDDADLVTRVASAARGGLAAPQAGLVERFVQLYFGGADPQELAARDPGDLAGAALAHLDFGRRHAGGAARVRVFNPKLAEHGW